jgi:hypothetical protein
MQPATGEASDDDLKSTTKPSTEKKMNTKLRAPQQKRNQTEYEQK